MPQEVDNTNLDGVKIKAAPMPELDIGIDTEKQLDQNLIQGAEAGIVDTSALENFLSIAQTREQIYELIDTMSQDSMISAILETYAEDACERNENGQIVWCEGADEEVVNMVNYLLNTMNVDKHIYGWVYALIKYGDTYLRLYKESDLKDDLLFNTNEVNKRMKLHESQDIADQLNAINEAESKKAPTPLQEDVILHVSADNDHYVHYVEKVANPGEMFELTRYGKTMGYICAPTMTTPQTNDEFNTGVANYWNYKFKQSDVTVFQATDFVHATLEDNSSRTPEEVTIFLDDEDMAAGVGGLTYTVKRGQSLLANTFKTWRELSLLENAILLNRITKSSIVRAIQVEVGDMPQEKVQATLQRLKQLIEQKSSLKTGEKMQEYTNPGPIENNIYIPTHEGKGGITLETIGGSDADVKNLADLDYFQNELFGSLRVPKQFFGQTDDNAGFSGGESLSIISSRYGKAIKRIQDAILQALTDAINLMLLDKGLSSYINTFTLRMTTPVTREEIDRREAMSNQIRNIDDITRLLGDSIEDPSIKLQIVKALISTVVTDEEVLQLVQAQIDKLDNPDEGEGESGDEFGDETLGGEEGFNDEGFDVSPIEDAIDGGISEEEPAEEPEAEEALPTPAEAMGEEGNYGESLEEDLPTFEALGVDGLQ